ncbi:MAG: nitrous oxide reductase family maturation protein NosD, partial [Candidatus Thorarchaeota archaeon]
MNRKGLNLPIILAVLSLLMLNTSISVVGLDVEPAQTYTPHAIINIDGNTDFLAQDAAENWPGDGTPGNPIIITGYSFAAAEWMLRVMNTDLHFKFVDNQLDGILQIWCGVAIGNCANGVIKDNYVQRAAAGIHVVTVENFTIEGNEVLDSPFGGIIVEDGSQNVTVKNNIVYDNENYGIHIGNPYGSTTSHEVTITGNIVHGNEPGGIRLLEADDCVVQNNEIYDNTQKGLVVETGSHQINFNNITDCPTGIHILGGNATLEHNTISDVEYGISVLSENNTFSQNYVTNCEEIGMRFYYSYSDSVGGSHNVITGNVIANNTRWGIDITANAD